MPPGVTCQQVLDLPDPNKLLALPSTTMFNASVHWIPSGGQYEWIVGGTHLSDERYLTVVSTNPAADVVRLGEGRGCKARRCRSVSQSPARERR